MSFPPIPVPDHAEVMASSMETITLMCRDCPGSDVVCDLGDFPTLAEVATAWISHREQTHPLG